MLSEIADNNESRYTVGHLFEIRCPLRLVTVISIWVDVIYALLHRDSLTLTVKLFMLIHLVLASNILLECRRSESYHRIYGFSQEK